MQENKSIIMDCNTIPIEHHSKGHNGLSKLKKSQQIRILSICTRDQTCCTPLLGWAILRKIKSGVTDDNSAVWCAEHTQAAEMGSIQIQIQCSTSQ